MQKGLDGAGYASSSVLVLALTWENLWEDVHITSLGPDSDPP